MAFVRALELLFAAYFVVHIITTVVIDGQIIFPKSWYPKALTDATQHYADQMKDSLFTTPPLWFKSFVYVEMLIQLPFFFVAAYAFAKGSCSWMRMPVIVYAVEAMTSMVPIVATIAYGDFSTLKPPTGPSTTTERWQLLAVYLPFFIVPFFMMLTVMTSQRYSSKTLQQQQQQKGFSQKKRKD